jgi:hypothetical protein
VPRTSGVAYHWVRRESGGTSAVNTGQLKMSLVLAGSGTLDLTGAGALSMTLVLAGVGTAIPVVPTRARITHLRRRTK